MLPEPPEAAAIEIATPRRSLRAELPVLLAVAFAIVFLIKTFVIQAFFIPSGSMLPTLAEGDRVVVSRLSYRLHEPRRGDIVVFEAPSSFARPDDGGEAALPVRVARFFLETIGFQQPPHEDFIKRVIGLPGETVEGRGGAIVIDGRPLREPYLHGVSFGDFGPATVREGHLWVMGDNRGASSDSRTFQDIPIESVVGRAVVRVWPPSRVGFL